MLDLVHLIRCLCSESAISSPFLIVVLSEFCFLFQFNLLFLAVAFFHSRYLFLKVLKKIMSNCLLRCFLFELNHFEYFTFLESMRFSFSLYLLIFEVVFFASQAPQATDFFQCFLCCNFYFTKVEPKSFYHFHIH